MPNTYSSAEGEEMKVGPFSMTTTSALGASFLSVRATIAPANPPPTMTTRLRGFSLAGVWPPIAGFTRSVAAKAGRVARK
jgi:hypothetical protein